MIRSYDGDVNKLGQAEKFFHQLIQLPDFKLRIEMMLLIEDFHSQVGTIRPDIQVLTSVCTKLMDNESLRVFLRFILHAGNFINKVNNPIKRTMLKNIYSLKSDSHLTHFSF